MDDSSTKFFEQLLATPSPSGFEQPIQALVRQYLDGVADSVSTDLHGNVIGVKNPGGKLRVMLAGHCDQIGMLVQYIDDRGYIYAQPIGGWDPQVLIGQRMTVWTQQGGVAGMIARKAIHLQSDEEKRQVAKLKDLWIDIGAKDKKDAEERVRIGDPITLELRYTPLLNNLACSPAMDNKTGVWVVLEAFKRAAKYPLDCALHVVSTVQEEIGLRGAQTSAFSIDAQVGIAVDVCHATDCPTNDKQTEGDVRLGLGPVVYRGPNMNPVVVERLRSVSAEKEIAVQWAASGKATPTDANTMQISRGGMATALVSIPNRYMHSPVETISLADIDRAADLLAEFVRTLKADDCFKPR